MNFRKKSKGALPTFQMTAMMDIVFLLLCFFVTTSVFSQWEYEVAITLPSAQSGKVPDRLPGEIIINITLFPAVSDIIDAPLLNGVSFQDALRHASDPVYREAALRQAGLVKLAAMGRDGTFLAVSKAYEAFLLAFAKGRKPGELVKLLLAADDALRAMEAQTADIGRRIASDGK